MPDELSFQSAWEQTVTGDRSFYRSSAGDPYLHFTTDVVQGQEVTDRVEALVVDVVRKAPGIVTVLDVGSGRGALLSSLAVRLEASGLLDRAHLIGVDLRDRPADLDSSVDWITADARALASEMPSLTGVIVAHEFLDDIPCDCVEVDPDGAARIVTVDAVSRQSSLGPPVSDPADLAWLARWWPARRPFMRLEIGRPRDDTWSGLTSMLSFGTAIAIDYGHLRVERASGFWDGGTVTGYLDGRTVSPATDGTCNITAHVAMDAVAAAAARARTTELTRWSAAPRGADFLSLVQTFA